ncbi:lactate utilization protein B/C [Sulfobacillus thermotolerans]|uniref:Lactate utilization protein B/C n=1 Tax=Sulfobacillus thermotolerans TaxID=338644 RepID=A0ABN5H0J3_9FIRM|nr:lactate utilization protein B/C [Sulfobacillus thermotolerans]
MERLPHDPRPWPARRDEALHDPVLQATLRRVTHRLNTARIQAYQNYPAGAEARERAKHRKREAVREWEPLLAQAEQQITAHGGQVFRAATPGDVGAYIKKVAQEHGVQRIIKSKSMATEEVQLNAQLEATGFAVRETDLGEYIIQLAHEKPSHILAPAAHKNRQQIQALFRETVADAHDVVSDDIPGLTQFARQKLRQDFLSADMGITGGNFLVAETGTVVVITNEGNADMVTTLPRILISLVGLEKIVQDWDALIDIIQQPALSGVGQRLSSYTTMISGPRGPESWEGPDEWHVVLLDNGRQAIHDGPYQDVLACIRCGACLNVCPVFQQVGGHGYGSVYSGPIGTVISPLIGGMQTFGELPRYLCTVCYACQEACPMDIPLPEQIIGLRSQAVAEDREPAAVRTQYRLWGQAWSTVHGYRRSVQAARIAQRLALRHVGLAAGWLKTRKMPPVAARTFLEGWAHEQRRRRRA